MREKTYFITLSDSNKDRLRVNVGLEKGQVVHFVVQYEALIENEWRAVVRYDTAHRFSHKDILHPDGTQDKQPIYFPNFNMALSFAIMDLKNSWPWYRTAYEKESKP